MGNIEDKPNISKMCRSCGTETATHISIETPVEITKEEVKFTLKKLIELTTSVPVNTTDGLSKTICHKCMYELINAYMFINKFKKTNVKLNKKIKNINKTQTNTKEKKLSNTSNIKEESSTTSILNQQNLTNTKLNEINKNISTNNLQILNKVTTYNLETTFVSTTNTEKKSENDCNTFKILKNSLNNSINQSMKNDNPKHETKINLTQLVSENKENINISDLIKIKSEPAFEFKTEIKNENDDKKVDKWETISLDSEICEEEDEFEEEFDDSNSQEEDGGWLSTLEDMELMTGSDSNSDSEAERIRTCYFCDKSFDNRNKFRKHIMYHKKNKKRCHICGDTFHYSKQLQYHLKIAHGAFTMPTQHECSCGKSFGSAGNLKRHQKTHDTIDKNVSVSSGEQ